VPDRILRQRALEAWRKNHTGARCVSSLRSARRSGASQRSASLRAPSATSVGMATTV
jgi:hypothetical protein